MSERQSEIFIIVYDSKNQKQVLEFIQAIKNNKHEEAQGLLKDITLPKNMTVEWFNFDQQMINCYFVGASTVSFQAVYKALNQLNCDSLLVQEYRDGEASRKLAFRNGEKYPYKKLASQLKDQNVNFALKLALIKANTRDIKAALLMGANPNVSIAGVPAIFFLYEPSMALMELFLDAGLDITKKWE